MIAWCGTRALRRERVERQDNGRRPTPGAGSGDSVEQGDAAWTLGSAPFCLDFACLR